MLSLKVPVGLLSFLENCELFGLNK